MYILLSKVILFQDEPAVNQLPQRETEQRKRNVPTKDMTKLYINEELEKEDEEVSVPELIEYVYLTVILQGCK